MSHFSIFSGDPKRIQKANEVQVKDFDSKVTVTPNPASLRALTANGGRPTFKVQFFTHNHGKKTFTLSFQTAQRWDFQVISPNNEVVYTYTDDHAFVDTVGTSMVDPDDKLVYTCDVDTSDLKMQPGTYYVNAHMANYVEMRAQCVLVIQP